MEDVAQLAKVSKSTVSQYINGRYQYMGNETKNRIKKAIKELDYQANYIAKSLKQKRTYTIGVIVANILHTFSTKLIRSIEDLCHKHDVHVIICNADDNSEKEKKYISMLRAKQVDGLIIVPTHGNIETYKKMVREQYPLVFVDRCVYEMKVDTFLLDNIEAAKTIIKHFIEKGHDRIGMITTPIVQQITPRIERVEGYKLGLKSHNIKIDEDYIKNVELQEIEGTLKEMMSLRRPPTALFAGNDLVLINILKFVKNNNFKIPNDFALASIDDVPFGDIYTPSITTLSQPVFEIGEKAAKVLLERIKNKDSAVERSVHRFKGKLIVRDSS